MINISNRLSVLIATVSTRRYRSLLEGEEYKDESGDLAEKMFINAGFRPIKRILIKDSPEMIRKAVDMAVAEGFDVLLFIGGTGVAKDDVTVEVVSELFEKEIPGFNILYTLYSEREVGPRAMSSRASAGIYKNVLIYAVPGSVRAVKLCVEKLIIPEARHLLMVYRGLKH